MSNFRLYFRELPSAPNLQPSLLSSVKSHIPALLLSLYLFSFWILPQGWNEDNPLDGSWRYAFGKFRELGLSLGRDSWFTYGPVAHWFGAPMGAGQYQPLPYYLLGLCVTGIVGYSFSRILNVLEMSYRFRLVAVLIFPICFIGMAGVQEIHLIIALMLLTVQCCLEERPDTRAVAALIFLGASGILYKISFGILSLFSMVCLLSALCAGGRITFRFLSVSLATYVAAVYALFVLVSGSSDLVTYLALGLETSEKYSEIMIRNMPYSPFNYVAAVIFMAAGGVLAWQASYRMAGKSGAICLLTIFFATALMLFKHGFVRADTSHIKIFYSGVAPWCAVLALISYQKLSLSPGRFSKGVWWSCTLLLATVFVSMLNFLPGEHSPIKLVTNWLTIGSRMAAGMQGQGPEVFPEKRAFVRNSQPQLFNWLNRYGATFGAQRRKPRITFYPWELIHFEGVDGYELAPPPSLQLYSTGPHSKTHQREQEFLSSKRRPDVIVVGPGAIDDRSAVSELTDLVSPLYAHYRVAAIVDGFTILEAHESGKTPDAVIRYSETPTGAAGEFLRISIEQSGVVNKLLWRLAATFFKAPELAVVATVTSGSGEKVEYAWRGYLSQLQGGVLFSPESIPEFFGAHFRTSPELIPSLPRATTTIKGAVAEVRRSGGFWNLPVIPLVVPLKVHYGNFRMRDEG